MLHYLFEFINIYKKENLCGRIYVGSFQRNEKYFRTFLLRFLDDNSMGLLKYDFETNDQESAERDAHTLKGLAANLGPDELSRRAAECVDIIRAGNYAAARQQYPHILEEYAWVV